MVKVTPHENLVPDIRGTWVKSHPYHDFINNQIQAYKFIRAACFFFQLRKGGAVFSGNLRERKEGVFTIKLWHEDEVLRSIRISGLGYEGVLHAEVVGELAEVIGWDWIGSLALNKEDCLAAAVG
jgi:hypothetical protein